MSYKLDTKYGQLEVTPLRADQIAVMTEGNGGPPVTIRGVEYSVRFWLQLRDDKWDILYRDDERRRLGFEMYMTRRDNFKDASAAARQSVLDVLVPAAVKWATHNEPALIEAEFNDAQREVRIANDKIDQARAALDVLAHERDAAWTRSTAAALRLKELSDESDEEVSIQ